MLIPLQAPEARFVCFCLKWPREIQNIYHSLLKSEDTCCKYHDYPLALFGSNKSDMKHPSRLERQPFPDSFLFVYFSRKCSVISFESNLRITLNFVLWMMCSNPTFCNALLLHNDQEEWSLHFKMIPADLQTVFFSLCIPQGVDTLAPMRTWENTILPVANRFLSLNSHHFLFRYFIELFQVYY